MRKYVPANVTCWAIRWASPPVGSAGKGVQRGSKLSYQCFLPKEEGQSPLLHDWLQCVQESLSHSAACVRFSWHETIGVGWVWGPWQPEKLPVFPETEGEACICHGVSMWSRESGTTAREIFLLGVTWLVIPHLRKDHADICLIDWFNSCPSGREEARWTLGTIDAFVLHSDINQNKLIIM